MKSFNIRTSEWIGIYVFRRLKFMKSIVISQAIVFLFVALWHGLEFGYFAVFGLLSFSMLFDRFFFPYFEKTKIFTFYLAKNQGFELCRKVIGTACRLFCLPFIPMGFQVTEVTNDDWLKLREFRNATRGFRFCDTSIFRYIQWTHLFESELVLGYNGFWLDTYWFLSSPWLQRKYLYMEPLISKIATEIHTNYIKIMINSIT